MNSAVWKLAALAGVVGAGFLFVYQAHTNLSQKAAAGQPRGGEEHFIDPDMPSAGGSSERADDFEIADADSQATHAGLPPRQAAEPGLPPQSEPTPIFADAADEIPDDSFSQDTSTAAADRRWEDERDADSNRFADLVRSLAEPAREDDSSAHSPAEDHAPPARFAQVDDPGRTGGTATEPVNPFADPADHQPMPEERDPAAGELSFAGGSPDHSQPTLPDTHNDPFGSDRAPLTRVNSDAEQPRLTPPPFDAADIEPPPEFASHNAEDAAGYTRTAGNEPVLPAEAPQIAQSSNARDSRGFDSGGFDASDPFPVLPQQPGPEPNSPRERAPAATASLPGANADRQPRSGGVFPEPPPAATQGETPTVRPDGTVEMTIHSRSRDQQDQSDDVPEMTSPGPSPDQGFDPFAGASDAQEPSQTPDPTFAAPPGELFPGADDRTLPAEGPERDDGPMPPTFDHRSGPPASNAPANNPQPATAAPRQRLKPDDLLGIGTVGSNSPIGTQQAQLTIEKEAPPDAVIGAPLVYSIHVTNIGQSVAENVVVKDLTPKGSRLVGTVPQAELDDSSGTLIWRLGRFEAGDLRTIKVKVIPTQAGQIGSVATVSFEAAVASRTVITSPELQLTMQGPSEVSVGEKAPFKFTLANVGSADANGVYVRNLIPEGFEHPGGNDLEYDVGVLKKGETKDVELSLLAVAPGQFQNQAILGADGDLAVETSKPVSILSSRLKIHREGPANRFVGRQARFINSISNESSTTLNEVSVVETVPPGVQFEAASNGGRFDPQSRTITWQLPQLEPGGRRQLQTILVPTQAGERISMIKATDPRGNAAETKSQLTVAGFSSLKVDVVHDGAPVPVGEDVALRLTVKNRGTAAASQIKTLVEIPPQMRFVNATGPVRHQVVGGNVIQFETLNSLAINAEQQFDIVLTAAQKGDARVRVELQAAELSSPLNQEELVVIHPVQE